MKGTILCSIVLFRQAASFFFAISLLCFIGLLLGHEFSMSLLLLVFRIILGFETGMVLIMRRRFCPIGSILCFCSVRFAFKLLVLFSIFFKRFGLVISCLGIFVLW